MKKITIHEMRDSDIEEVSRVVCDSFRWSAERDGYTAEQIAAYVSERGSPEALRGQFPLCQWLVACAEDTIVGVAAVKGNEIDKLYVDPRFLRQGIGKRLFQAAEDLIARAGHKEVVLGTAFPASLPFYRAMGMQESGRKIIAIGPFKGRASILLTKPLFANKTARWSKWLRETVEEKADAQPAVFSQGHQKIADSVIDHAAIGPGQRVLDVGTGTGLLAFSIAVRFGSRVEVIGVDIDRECLDLCRKRAAEQRLGNTTFLLGDAVHLPLDSASVDAVVCRSVLCHILDRQPVFQEWRRILKPQGRFSIYEPVDRYETCFSELVNFSPLGELAVRLREAEERFHHSPTSSLMNFDEHDLQRILEQTGFEITGSRLTERKRDYTMTAASARDWWHLDMGGSVTPGHSSPYVQLGRYTPASELDRCVEFFCAKVDGKTITYHTKQLFMWGTRNILDSRASRP